MKNLFCFFLLLSLLFSCKKKDDVSPAPPVIKYGSFGYVSEKEAYFKFTFHDNDGDIGLKDSDTTGSYSHKTFGYYDFYMQYLFRDSSGNYEPAYSFTNHIDSVSGQTVQDTIFDSKTQYRIPFVENNTKSQSLDGEVMIKLDGFRPGKTPAYQHFKTIFYMYDRALHKSNVVTTPDIYVP